MSKHTPGPWWAKREGFSTIYVEARIEGGLIQEVAACGPTEAGKEQQEANARLIAAAPELLEALQMCRVEMPGTRFKKMVFDEQKVAAAIAKATGEQA